MHIKHLIKLCKFEKDIQDTETHVQSLCADLEDREAQLRAQEEEMKERDAEINRLLGELRQLRRQQVQ